MNKTTGSDEYEYWYKKAEFFMDNQTKDYITNLLLLASELRNQFQLGILQGIHDVHNNPR
jgi:hypothetical protein